MSMWIWEEAQKMLPWKKLTCEKKGSATLYLFAKSSNNEHAPDFTGDVQS